MTASAPAVTSRTTVARGSWPFEHAYADRRTGTGLKNATKMLWESRRTLIFRIKN